MKKILLFLLIFAMLATATFPIYAEADTDQDQYSEVISGENDAEQVTGQGTNLPEIQEEEFEELQAYYASDCAVGFTGTSFIYSDNGYYATLQMNNSQKTKPMNMYSESFRYYVHRMDELFDSFSPVQKSAWFAVRLYMMMNVFPTSMPSVVTSIVMYSYLLSSGVDLGDQMQATALGMAEFYNAEMSAIEAYNNF